MVRYCFMIFFMIFAAAFTCATPARAQNNPLSTEARSDYGIVREFVIRAAEKMPEEDYGFKPTPEVRSFGQLIGHIADKPIRVLFGCKKREQILGV
jgi:hypothetical protein